MERLARFAVVLTLTLPAAAQAQGLPGEVSLPGASVASVAGADALRVNPGGVGVGRTWSLRATSVHPLEGAAGSLGATAVSFASPLPFGFGVAVGAQWHRPELPSPRTGPHWGSFDLGLAYAFTSRLTVGLQFRTVVTAPDTRGDLSTDAAMDVGALWRPSAHFALGLTARNVWGPRSVEGGIDTAFVGGAAVRPTGSDALTFGADASLDLRGQLVARGAARVAIPHVGFLRAEGVYEFGAELWRAGVGLDVRWGAADVGVGGYLGAGDRAGLAVSAGLSGERSAVSLPSPTVTVTVPLTDEPGPRGFARLLLRLERLRRDPSVRGVLFAPRADVPGLASGEELRDAFQRLRRGGVRVGCHLTEANTATWFACAGVDRITVDPAGGVRMQGLRSARYFLGPALWDLGVRTDFVRIADWKSAAEQLTRGSSTPTARAQEESLLDGWFATLLRGAAAQRSALAGHASQAITGGPYTAREALSAQVVDAVVTLDVAERAMSRATRARAVELDDYVAEGSRRWAPGPAVAVIWIDGDIVDGESRVIPLLGNRMSGDRDVVQSIEAAAANPRVGAIVLRVDSPGGSALASDLIWRAVTLASRRKPVVASFGRVAASGGYYVAAGAREIFTNAFTLTGSIGIFYGKADVANLLARLHVGVELSRRGDHADMDSVFRPYDPAERRLLGQKIGEFYNLFLRRVAAGRHRDVASVDAVGEGRVFTGERALEHGLVDRVGGFLDALDRARELAGLRDDAEIVNLPEEPGGLLRLVTGLLTTASGPSALGSVLPLREAATLLRWLSVVGAHSGRPMAMTELPMDLP
ncbi:MAG: signal peptide peptidase SppA [Polyangiales bacterium]